MASGPSLVLIDVMPLLYRGHFAFANRPRMTSGGVNTSAIYIFCLQVVQMLKEASATHVALAMDTKPAFRLERYPEYKAQRDKMPEDIAASIPMAEEFAKALRMPFLRVEGFEADDVIGTLSRLGEAAGMPVCLFTPDKDYAQLVTPGVTLCRPGKGDASERYGVAEVCEKWGLSEPRQMIDWLGMAGDSADNIPGIAGVGEKTASKLLQEYGSLENLIAHSAHLKGKLRERVEQSAETARLSRWLAEIRTDVPIDFSLDDLRVAKPDLEAFHAFLAKYELLPLKARLLSQLSSLDGMGDLASASRAGMAKPAGVADDLPLFAATAPAAPAAPQPAPETDVADLPLFAFATGGAETVATTVENSAFRHRRDWNSDYILVDTDDACRALAEELRGAKAFAFDTETTGLDVFEARPVGMSFCIAPGKAWYVTLPQDAAARAARIRLFEPALRNPEALKIGHNLKFDIEILHFAGLDVCGPFSDTMLAHYVVDPAEFHGMDRLAKSLLGYEPIPISALIGAKGPGQLTMDQVAVDKVCEYAAEDAEVTLRLHGELRGRCEEAGAADVLDRCENALLPVLVDIECTGVRVDLDALAAYGRELGAEIASLEAKIREAAGEDFNLASPRQLGHILFETLGLPPAGRTATGQYETSEEVLQALRGKHPVVELILEHRACTKLKSTYIDRLPECVRSSTGRVHTTFNQANTATGRLSSDNPNLQNIPVRTERGRRIRAAFVARDADHVLMSADYSQIELRLMAALSGDEAMIAAFRDGADIHRQTAARVHGVAPEAVTPAQRAEAKMVNFGIVYGISANGLAQRLGISRSRAAELIAAHRALYPGVAAYMERTVAFAREHGYVRTPLGRRRPLRDINSRNATQRSAAERFAINTPVQGAAADLMKLAMVAVHDGLRERGLAAKMVLQIHDELVLDVPRGEVDAVRDLVTEAMTTVQSFPVPLEVEVGVGDNWLEAH